MVIVVLNHVSQCYSTDDGLALYRVLHDAFARTDDKIALSFHGVDGVTSSFVNASIVALLDHYAIATVKARLSIIDASKQTADMIRRCMANADRRHLQYA